MHSQKQANGFRIEAPNVRHAVSRAYANAVTVDSVHSGGIQKGFVVKLAGYGRDSLCELPEGAVVNSFGCGNPLAFCDVTKGQVVLDLGCGAGIDVLLAARAVGPDGRAIGVDMTEEMVAKARESVAASGLSNIEIRKGLIEDLPVESASVDWVISNCVINLSPEKDRVFNEIARVLKPGGCMLVSDIVAEPLPEPVRASLDSYCSCIAGTISEVAYCTGLRHAGLVDTEIRQRIHYDAAQLVGLLESDAGAWKGIPCCLDQAHSSGMSLRELAATCVGKVWSTQVFARKPAHVLP